MSTFFEWFWTAMIFLSIAWYFLLLFYVGYKGGVEIFRMARPLSARSAQAEAQRDA